MFKEREVSLAVFELGGCKREAVLETGISDVVQAKYPTIAFLIIKCSEHTFVTLKVEELAQSKSLSKHSV